MNDKHSPAKDPLGRLGIVGHPWHGVCAGATLTLPNAQTMPYRQPVGGDAIAFAVPGTPAVTRTPEQLAADAAAGIEWRNSAVLSGSEPQLYGKPLGPANSGRWLYADPSGARWLVSTTLHEATLTGVEGASVTVTLKRFGEVPGTPEEHTYTVSVPALGQDSPTVTHPDGGDLAKSQIKLRRFSMSRDGSRAAFMLYVDVLTRQTQWPIRPVGWCELTISGAGGAALVEVVPFKSRAETLGTLSHSYAADPVCLYQEVVRASVSEGGPAPTCGGTTTKFTTTEDVFVGAPGMEGGDVYLVATFQNSLEVNSIDKIIAVNYGASGLAEPMIARYTLTDDREYELSLTVIAEYEEVVERIPSSDLQSCVDGPLISSITREIDVVATLTQHETLKIDVIEAGVALQSYDSGAIVSVGVSHYTDYSYGVPIATTLPDSQSASSSYAGASSLQFANFRGMSTAVSGGVPVWQTESLIDYEMVTQLAWNLDGEIAFYWCPTLHGNRAVGVHRRKRDTLTPSRADAHYIGTQTITTQTAYASRDPETGQLVGSASPVCWV